MTASLTPSAIYTYTPNGKVETVTDAESNTTVFEYDGFDRLSLTRFPDQETEGLEYDAASNVTQRTLRSGQSIAYQYDALGRLQTKSPSGSPTVTYQYDIAGRIESEALGGVGSTDYQYDDVGRLESKTDMRSRTVGYMYDAAGNRTRITYPGGDYVTYVYDEENRLVEISDSGVALPLTTFEYDELSRLKTQTRRNGANTSYDWEIDNDIEGISHDFSGSSASWAYTYDAVHNRRVTSISDPQFQFDLSAIIPTTYTNNEMNQHTTATLGGATSHSFAYDLNGNLTVPISNSYQFDAQNRLVSATVSGNQTAGYTYDPSGLRLTKTVGNATTEYLLDGNQILEEYDGAGNLLRRYVYAGLDRPVRMTTTSGTEYYYHQDALGSVVGLSSASGGLVESYAYGPYGQLNTASSVSNPFFYTGREYDPESGLYYYRARFYDPEVGRFLQPDPLGYADGLGLYAYVGSNPVNFADPLGLFRTSQGGLPGVTAEKTAIGDIYEENGIAIDRSGDAEKGLSNVREARDFVDSAIRSGDLKVPWLSDSKIEGIKFDARSVSRGKGKDFLGGAVRRGAMNNSPIVVFHDGATSVGRAVEAIGHELKHFDGSGEPAARRFGESVRSIYERGR